MEAAQIRVLAVDADVRRVLEVEPVGPADGADVGSEVRREIGG